MSSDRARQAGAGSLAAMGLLLAAALSRTGATYDEPAHIALGSVIFSAPAAMTRSCPPLPAYLRDLALLPLHAAPARPPAGRESEVFTPHDFGVLFLSGQTRPAAEFLRAARLPSIAITLLLAALLWFWGNALGGGAAAAAAVYFCAFEPNLLAHGSLATTDAFVAAFFAAALYAWAAHLKSGQDAPAAWAGAAAGAAIASKATGLVLLPAFALSWLWCRKKPRGLIVAAAAAAAASAALYLPVGLGAFADMLLFRAGEAGRPGASYLFGTAYPNGHPLYYPAVLLVKTTLPLLALGLAGALRLRRERPEDFRAAAAGSALLLAAMIAGSRQLGARYLLPLYPVLCAAAGWAAADLWKRFPRPRPLLALLLAWHAASSLTAFAHPLAYFNELVGGPEHGRMVLGDSNLDWGQSLPDLRRFIDANPGGLILSYFGKDCPSAYGLNHQAAFSTPGPCPAASNILPTNAEREWLAVSVTKWQGFYESGPPMWGWLREKTPYAMLGYSMLVYDVTNDADAHEKLAAMYDRAGDSLSANRERARASLLKK